MKHLPFAVLTLALLAGPVLAQDNAGVLTGTKAFGGWQDDAPGVRRHLTPADLPPPTPSENASNEAKIVPRPAELMPKVPEGFAVELVAEGIGNPRAIRFAPNGDLFVSDSAEGNVLVYHFENGAAKPARHAVFAKGLDQPYGIAFYPADKPTWVYVAEASGLKRFPYKDGDMVASAPPETILEGVPTSRHWTRDVVFSPDGKTMYYSVGSGSNVGLDSTMKDLPAEGVDKFIADHSLGVAWGGEEGRAAVMAFDPDGNNGRYFATGIRNCAGMTVQPATGNVWCAVNERDGLGDNVPFDYATSVKQGAFYGWPWFYIGDHPDPRWSATPREDIKDQVTIPEVLFQTHSAPLNIVFDPSDAWGADMKGAAFVALHGSWNRNTRTGYKVVKLDIGPDGKATGVYEDFVTGFVISNQEVWGRPVGVAFDPSGNLFVSDDGSGSIWKVSKK